MKRFFWYIIVIISYTNIHALTPAHAMATFDIIIDTTWEHLSEHDLHKEKFNGKWIELGTITFKKNSNENVYLDEIILVWKGQETFSSLEATLYKQKCPSKKFLPIDENLVCDGQWRQDKQELVMRFNQRESLGTTTIFHVIITVPQDLEHKIAGGQFTLKKHCLPEQYKQCVHDQSISVAHKAKMNSSTIH